MGYLIYAMSINFRNFSDNKTETREVGHACKMPPTFACNLPPHAPLLYLIISELNYEIALSGSNIPSYSILPVGTYNNSHQITVIFSFSPLY